MKRRGAINDRDRQPLRRRPKKAVGTREQRAHFHSTVLRRDRHCPVVDDGRHDGPLEAHHVIPQEALKKILDAKSLPAVLWDPEIGRAVCRRHHGRHTGAARRLPASVLTPRAREIAEALGLGHVLDKTYRKETDA
jgi:hypothetical protein